MKFVSKLSLVIISIFFLVALAMNVNSDIDGEVHDNGYTTSTVPTVTFASTTTTTSTTTTSTKSTTTTTMLTFGLNDFQDEIVLKDATIDRIDAKKLKVFRHGVEKFDVVASSNMTFNSPNKWTQYESGTIVHKCDNPCIIEGWKVYNVKKKDHIEYIDYTPYNLLGEYDAKLAVLERIDDYTVLIAHGAGYDPSLNLSLNLTLNMTFGYTEGFANQTYYGDVNGSEGILDGASEFDGVNDYIEIGTSSDFSTVCNNGCTFAMWDKHYDSTADNLMGRYDTTDSDRFFKFIRQSDGDYTVFFSRNGTAVDINMVTTGEYDSNWHFFTVVFDGTNTTAGNARIYVDGVLNVTSGTTMQIDSSAWSDSESTFIGVSDETSKGGFYNGSIDEVIVISRNITQAEINSLYQAGSPTQRAKDIITDNITFYSSMNNLYDFSSNNYFGKTYGNLTLTNATYNTSRSQNAFEFDGIDDFINYSNSIGSFCDNGCSVCNWAKPYDPAPGTANNMFTRYGGVDGTRFYQNRIDAGNFNYRFVIGANGIQGDGLATLTVANTTSIKGQWVHLCFVYNGSTSVAGNMTIWENGVMIKEGTGVIINSSAWTSSSESYYMSRQHDRFFNGTIDDLLVYKRALNSTEILNLYDGTVPDETPPSITIDSPTNTTYSSASIDFNVTSDETLESCDVSWDNFVTNHSMDVSGLTANFTNSSMTDGGYTAIFACYDSDGNVNNTETVSFTVANITLLTLTANLPTNTTYTTSSIDFNVSGDNNLDSCIVSWDSYVTNHTMTISGTTANYTNTSMTDGGYTALYWCNDTSDNEDTVNVSFTIDTSSFTLTINSPTNITYYSLSLISTDFNVTGNQNLDSCVVSWDAFVTNHTMTIDGLTANYTNSSMTYGGYTASYSCNSTIGNRNNTETVSFTLSNYTFPSFVSLNSNTSNIEATGIVNFTAVIQNGSHALDEWYITYNGTTTGTESAVNGTNDILWDTTNLEGNYTIVAYVNDTEGNSNTSSTIYVNVFDIRPDLSNVVTADYNVSAGTIVTINGTVAQQTYSLDDIWFTYNDTVGDTDTATAGVNNLQWNTLGLFGNYTIVVNVNDTQNNTNTSTIYINVYRSNPFFSDFQVSDLTPTQGDYITVTGTIDNNSNILEAFYFNYNSTQGNITASPVNGSNVLGWDTSGLAGTYNVIGYVNATDGQSNTSVTRSVTIATTTTTTTTTSTTTTTLGGGRYQSTTFSSGNTSANLSITGNTTHTLYIQLPRYTTITNSTFNVTPYQSPEWVFQDEDYAEDYDRQAGGPTTIIYTNFSLKGVNKSLVRLEWRNSSGGFTYINVTPPSRCINLSLDQISIKHYRSTVDDYLACHNGTAYETLYLISSPNSGSFLGAYFYQIYPYDSYVSTPEDGSPYLYNTSFEFNTSQTLNLTDSINGMTYHCDCTDCSIASNVCTFPLYVHANVGGNIYVDALEINYEYIFDLTNCSTGTPSINFTILNESSDAQVVNATIEGVFDYSMTDSINGEILRNYSFSVINQTESVCIFPNWLYLEGTDFQIEYNAPGSTDIFSYFGDDINFTNSSRNIDLYVVDGTDQVLFNVKDTDSDAVVGAYIEIQKYNVGTNQYTTTEILKTDNSGNAIGNIVLYNVFYRIYVRYDGTTYITDAPTKFITTTRNYVIAVTADDWYDGYDTFRGINYNLTFNTATNNFRLEYSDTGAEIERGCLRVMELNSSGNTLLGDTCNEATGATILHNVAAVNGSNYLAVAYVQYSDDSEYILDTIDKSFDVDWEVFNDKVAGIGVFATWMFVTTLALLGVVISPVIGLIFACVGLFGAALLNIWVITWTKLTVLLIMIGIAIWRMQQK